MTRKRLRAVLFGPQGCGKGTQGQLLSDRYSVPLVGSGDLIRAEMEERSALGRLIEPYVSHGMLAPDELVNAILTKQLKQLDLERGFLFDGYPRNVEQAELFDKQMRVNLAIQIKLSDATAVKRLAGRRQCSVCRSVFHVTEAPPIKPNVCSLCGGKLVVRPDDTEAIIRERLAAYHFMTEPMAVYYRKRGVLLAVNGEQSILQLFEELSRKLAKLGFVA